MMCRAKTPRFPFLLQGSAHGRCPRSQSCQIPQPHGALIREVTLRPDATAGTPVATRVLLENVKSIDLEFVRGGQRSDFWQGDAVASLSVLPDLIEMNIAFENDVMLSIAALTGGRA